VDLVRLGLGIRALRRRRGWRQRDLAAAAGVNQTAVSLIERGHADRVSMSVLRDVAAALDARLVLQIRWRAGDLDRLLDADHAQLSADFVRRLQAAGWETRVEFTYATRGSSGSIDVLAFHHATQSLLVIEVKTEVPSAEATLRKLDEKVRVAAAVARDRFGWLARTVSALLVLEDTSTNRRRIDMHTPLFDAALPDRGIDVRRWLASPSGRLGGRMFLAPSTGSAVIKRRGGRHRIRQSAAPARRPGASVARDGFETDDLSVRRARTILVG
jgi:transcriptional regulator with XRE-family HTH domain